MELPYTFVKKQTQKYKFENWLLKSTIFLCIFKNTGQNNICVPIVFKAKTKQKYEEQFF